MRRAVLQFVTVLVTVVIAAAVAATSYAAAPYHPAGPVEARYFDPGPWQVTEKYGFGCCDSTGAAYDLWYPTDLGHGDTRYPILTWGNGTDARPRQYAYLLRHLASWGFVVIATENRRTGNGTDILRAARYLIDRAADPKSPFHDRLDTSAIGAIGHSQGATGALNAMIASSGSIRTAVPMHLPAQALCSKRLSCTDPTRLTRGSVFFVNGSDDALISPSRAQWKIPGLQSNFDYYRATPASVTKVWGTLVGPNHNDVQGQPGCAEASSPCTDGVYGYLGYPTAWLVARLQNCPHAAAAFAPGTGEFYAPNPHWGNQTGANAR
ncbi:poly(ethylene terephthalate) hydrolase family protein [Nocardia vermiculata]|uniref:Alpha/beta hydrolase n=1 Tax=Nocardia vermiculata TaxID=257274 RepID=A0A846Y9X7_9NOCA|nr:alpha/beta hydrolase [Nocardia vermiculata]NKY53559.1 alpha/beta hydrolase [Nocardia vermiculata]